VYEYRRLTPRERERLVEERISRGFPPHQPPHPARDEQLYLLTAACYEHCHYLHTPQRRQELLDMLFDLSIRQGIEIRGWVILTNHYHLLVHVSDFGLLGRVLRRVHGVTSHAWNQAEGKAGRKVWYRYSDRAIRSERHYYVTLNYIHYNPVKHANVASPYEWPCSSVHWYLEHHGREWLRDLWVRYPVRSYGESWDVMSCERG
jgi:putative transposase